MSGIIHRQQKCHSSTIQPLDRHLAEIGESDGTIYINAGIDSTCCNKRSRTMHQLTNGIVVSTSIRNFNEENKNLLNRNSYENECNLRRNVCCSHCGK